MKTDQKCGARARSTGQPCVARAMLSGRCRNHGGLSTGPRTEEGRSAIAMSNKRRATRGLVRE